MTNRIIQKSLILFLVFFSCTRVVQASFEITEIMYDLDGTDTSREWVEVHNTGSDASDLSRWYLFSDNTKHSLVPDGDPNIPAGGYAVIVQDISKFKIDWPNYSGRLFDSSWTGFSNDGESIALKDPDLNIVSPITFTSSQGGTGDGTSLQIINSVWRGSVPTPGAENQYSSGGSSGETAGTTTTTTQDDTKTTTTTKKKEIEIPKITTNIITKSTVFAGLPFELTAETLGRSKEQITDGRFVWNFGDGMIRIDNQEKPFEHIYKYPGDYIVTLSYYRTYTNTNLEASDRFAIKAISHDLSISSIGNDAEPFIELENKSSFEIDLSLWNIKGLKHSFLVPYGTIILPKSKLKLSPIATGFDSNDIKSISLEDQEGHTIYTYPIVKNTIQEINSQSYNPSEVKSTPPTSPNIIDLNDLGASTQNSNIDLSNKVFAEVGLVLIMLIGIASTIFLKNSKTHTDELEKDMKASDITILE